MSKSRSRTFENAQAPRTVELLAGEIDQSVANTSHHLQALERAQLVTTERDGLHVVYSIAGTDVGELLVHLQAVAATHIAGLEPVDRDTLLERLRARDVTLLDVRPERAFAEGHLPGALSVPLPLLEARLGELPRDRTIVAYGRGPFCTLSAEAVRRGCGRRHRCGARRSRARAADAAGVPA